MLGPGLPPPVAPTSQTGLGLPFLGFPGPWVTEVDAISFGDDIFPPTSGTLNAFFSVDRNALGIPVGAPPNVAPEAASLEAAPDTLVSLPSSGYPGCTVGGLPVVRPDRQ